MSGELAQHGAHRARIKRGQAQRQRDQFVVAGRHLVEDDAFQNGKLVVTHGVVRVHRLRGFGIERRRVDADQPDAMAGQQRDRLRRHGAESGIPTALRRLRVGAQEHARWRAGQCVRDVLRLHARCCANTVDHPARAQVGVQRDGSDRRAIRRVVQRGVGMGAGVWRHRDAADIHRAMLVELPGRVMLERCVARPDRRGGRNGWGNIPDAATVVELGGLGHGVSRLRFFSGAVCVGIIVKLPEKSLAKWAVDLAFFRIKLRINSRNSWILRNEP